MSLYPRTKHFIWVILLFALSACGQPDITSSSSQSTEAASLSLNEPISEKGKSNPVIEQPTQTYTILQPPRPTTVSGFPTTVVAPMSFPSSQADASSLQLGIEPVAVDNQEISLLVWVDAPDNYYDLNFQLAHDPEIRVLSGAIPEKLDIIAGKRQEYLLKVTISEEDRSQRAGVKALTYNRIGILVWGVNTKRRTFNETVTTQVTYNNKQLEIIEAENSTRLQAAKK